MQKLYSLKPAAMLAILLALSACSTVRFPGVYRIDIPQGNFVTSDMLADLQPVMTPEQVRYVLGVPTLVDPFTADTWFYLMTYQPGKGQPVDQQIVVHFNQGIYSGYEGEVAADMQRQTQAEKAAELHKKAERQIRESSTDEDGTDEESEAEPVPAEQMETAPLDDSTKQP